MLISVERRSSGYFIGNRSISWCVGYIGTSTYTEAWSSFHYLLTVNRTRRWRPQYCAHFNRLAAASYTNLACNKGLIVSIPLYISNKNLRKTRWMVKTPQKSPCKNYGLFGSGLHKTCYPWKPSPCFVPNFSLKLNLPVNCPLSSFLVTFVISKNRKLIHPLYKQCHPL